ncbi:MAG: tetratricopeptide repeat protein [Deltaproteobacteria bacterium]|nr:tetratricopeptide repeat protein [Deltaproteobacteria bacterium]
MKIRFVATVFVGLILLLSCGRIDKSKPASESSNTDTVKTDPKPLAQNMGVRQKPLPKKKSETVSTLEAGAINITKAQILSYQNLLRSGRRQVQSKKYDAGIAFYEKGLAIRPGDPTMLIELGYAAFLEGDLERATTATELGLLGAGNNTVKGAALYNLGRIAEQQGDKDMAAQKYRESLAVRPNNAVEKRLVSLTAVAETDTAPVYVVPEFRPFKGPLASLAGVCDALLGDISENYRVDRIGCEGNNPGIVRDNCANRKGCEGNNADIVRDNRANRKGCAVNNADIVEINEGSLRRGILLPIWQSEDGKHDALKEHQMVRYFLVVETDRGYFWTDEEVSHVWNPDDSEIAELIDISLSVENVVPGSPPEVLVKTKHSRRNLDFGKFEVSYEINEWVLVCGIHDNEWRCITKIPTAMLYEVKELPLKLGYFVEPVEDHTPNLPIHDSYDFDVSFDGNGNYTLAERTPPMGDPAPKKGIRAGTFLISPP